MNNLDLLRLAEDQDVEAYSIEDFEEESSKQTATQKYKREYEDFYDDIKQSSRYIKEDW